MRYSFLSLTALLAAGSALAQGALDPRPAAGSPAASGAAFTDPRLTNAFFTPTTYRGAFEAQPAGVRWDLPWANYDPQNTNYGSSATATPLSGNLASQTLTTGNRYILNGFVRVPDGAVLTIQPGVTIFGDSETTGTLIVERGGRINATGTAAQPIVFTSERPAGSRAGGDWGGIIIAGRAAVNLTGGTGTIEGGTGTTYGGGATPNAADNSGTLLYVRIEYGGIPFAVNNEINGLTMGAVGSGTTIDYVQISYNNDDSFEWFGGSVNAKHLISFAALDDDFDGDNGWNGMVQYALAVRDPLRYDAGPGGTTSGFEQDNEASVPGGGPSSPRTDPAFSNVTILGPLTQTATLPTGNTFTRAAHIRRAARTDIFNSILSGFPTIYRLDSPQIAAEAGTEVNIENNIATNYTTLASSSEAGFNAEAFVTAQPGNQTFPTIQAAGVNPNSPVDVEEGTGALAGFRLGVAPNPSRGDARILIELPEAGAVRAAVYDVLGREVATLVDGVVPAGERTVALQTALPAGTYVVRLQTEAGALVHRFTVVN